MKSVRLQGIYVGSRQMFEDMNRMLCQYVHIKPVIDKTFGFGEVKDALKYMESGAHFGKIVVKLISHEKTRKEMKLCFIWSSKNSRIKTRFNAVR